MAWQCGACGGENPEGMRFCGHCGAPAAAPVREAPLPAAVTPAGSAQPENDVLRAFVTGQVADRLVEAGGELTEERRLVTALFADLSGFTPLSERLDPEQLLEVIDPIIRALSDLVGQYEGFVEKFAGDALLALFGAPVAHEDDAVRALLVAGEMHRELARLRAELGPEALDLTLHIGVNTGHGVARMIGSQVRTDYAVLGDSVILAQRLESAAPPGETYIGETTHRLVKDRFDLEPVGALTLKGKAEPVPAWRVLAERSAAERSVAAVRQGAAFIGREAELRQVRSVLEELSAGIGGVGTVVGEPGVGKSRLTDEARLLSTALGIRWLEARCLSYGAGLAYWPFIDLVRRAAGIRVDDPVDTAAIRLHDAVSFTAPESLPFFARLLGLTAGTDGGLPQLEPEAFRRGLHDAFARWLRAIGREQPTVLALEDCHWADASTVDLLLELSRTLREEPVLLYLTARAGLAPLIERIEADETSRTLAVHLQPLDAAGVASLAENLLDRAPPSGLLPVLIERGAGNPFFVEEMIRSLLDTGAIVRSAGRWEVRPGWHESDVAPTIEGVLAARIDALPAGAARLLQVASVIGRRVRITLLRAVASEDGALDLGLQQLLAARLLDLGTDPLEEAVVFHHALLQDVAYGRLLRRRRRELHLRTAEAAERLYGAGDDVIDLLARHLYLGSAGSRAIEYLIRAGERARGLFANDEAIVHFTHAVELVRADPALSDRLPELLLTVADLHELGGSYDDARTLYEELRDLTHSIGAWRGIAATLRRQGRYAAALSALDHAFDVLADRHGDLRHLWLERGSTLLSAGHTAEAEKAFRNGLAASDTRDAIRAAILLQLGRTMAIEGRAGVAVSEVAEAASISEASSDLRGLATALRVLGGTYDDLGRLPEAAATLVRGLEIARRVGSAEEIGASLVNLALTQRNLGELEASIDSNRQALEEFRHIGHVSGMAVASGNLADALAHAGRLDEALEAVDDALRVATAFGHRLQIADATMTKGAILLRQGELADAATLAREAADLFDEVGATPSAAEARAIADQALSGQS